jgi:hypothetical protein
MTDAQRTIVQEWLTDKTRVRVSRDRKMPDAQDVEDVCAILDWREHSHYLVNDSALRMGASVVLAWKRDNEFKQ